MASVLKDRNTFNRLPQADLRDRPDKNKPPLNSGKVCCIPGMEPTGVEPVSALGINQPIVHRFSSSNPQSGNHPLSRMMGFPSKVLTDEPTRDG